MNSEIGTVLMHINGEWWKFRGMESIGWMICWSESEQRPYINECTGAAVYGERFRRGKFRAEGEKWTVTKS